MTYPQATVVATMATTIIIPAPATIGSGSFCSYSVATETAMVCWARIPVTAATTIIPAAIGSSGFCSSPTAVAGTAAVAATNRSS